MKDSKIQESHFQGEFWKPCPGTADSYLCCGYQIISPMRGCGMYCQYCILQAYLETTQPTVYDNFDDLKTEVQTKMNSHKEVIRFGSGEFADSLYSDKDIALSVKLADLLGEYPNVLLELKTKSIVLDNLHKIQNKKRVIIAFSLNTPRNINLFEKRTASLQQRLEAARKCEEMGFWVAFHFDPMIWYENWEIEYRHVVQQIFLSIKDPSKIAWVSLGGFRCVPMLKQILQKRGTALPLFSGEMIKGKDGKLRYIRQIRIKFYQTMQDEFNKHFEDSILYLCMENSDVWKDTNMSYRIPDGLISYLDNRAKGMLNI